MLVALAVCCRDGDQQLLIMMNESDKTDAFLSTEGYLTDYIKGYVASPTPAMQPVSGGMLGLAARQMGCLGGGKDGT